LLQKKDELAFSAKEFIEINIGTSDQEKIIKIGVNDNTQQQERYKNKFIECSENFACSYSNIPSLYLYFIMHILPLKK